MRETGRWGLGRSWSYLVEFEKSRSIQNLLSMKELGFFIRIFFALGSSIISCPLKHSKSNRAGWDCVLFERRCIKIKDLEGSIFAQACSAKEKICDMLQRGD